MNIEDFDSVDLAKVLENETSYYTISQYHTRELVFQWAPNWLHKRHNRRHVNITLVEKIVNQLGRKGAMLAQDLIGLCTLLLLGFFVSTRGEDTKSHLVNIEDIFYWRCPDLSGRQHWRGAILEEGCHRYTCNAWRNVTTFVK